MIEGTATKLFPSLLLLALVGGCSYRPPQFADSPPVVEVADNAPVPAPKPRDVGGVLDVSDLYLRYAIRDVLDPARVPTAGDVNSMDEVVRSTWFKGNETPSGRQPYQYGPPVLPFRVLPDESVTTLGGLRVLDARGLSYELQIDPHDRPEMRTSSAAITSHLVRAVGYLTPEVWPIDIAFSDLKVLDHSPEVTRTLRLRTDAFIASGPEPTGGKARVSATRWPIGLDLGPTPVSGMRPDDPNDRIPHHDRRTFRSFKLLSAWLKLGRYDEGLFRDAYVGEPRLGHVLHFVAGVDGALGASAVVRFGDLLTEGPPEDPTIPLLTFGFYPREEPFPTQTRWRAIGAMSFGVAPEDYQFTQPFEPSRRAQPDDLYWAAKRIAALSPELIARAVDAGRLTDLEAEEHLLALLLARQKDVAIAAYAAVTPCEPERVDGSTLWVRDEAIRLGIETPDASRYRVSFLNKTGELLAPIDLRSGASDTFSVQVPEEAFYAGYAVARIAVERREKAAPRAMEIHLKTRGGVVRILGVRH